MDNTGAVELFDPAEHEPLVEDEWDESVARSFVERILREADDAYDPDRGWPLHPEDRYGPDNVAGRGLYCGATGTMWALTRLARRYRMTLRNDYDAGAERCEERYRAHPTETGTVVPSYFLGTVGMLAARFAISGDPKLLDRMLDEMRANAGNPAREVLWGSPGTALPALLVRERDGDDRFDDMLRSVQDELWATWEPADAEGGLLWEQDLYGRRCRYVGAGHGAIGNLAPLVRAAGLLSDERREALFARVPALLETYAMRCGGAANWWSLAAPRFGTRMQWCHGAPGVVIGLAGYPTGDERVENLLIEAGEGIWRAGPLKKGPTLCHGTAGNGLALLRLAERTGADHWKRRAERFAMHAIRQVEQWREAFGMPTFSLWTGELGVAWYIDAVLRNEPALLTLDTL